MSSSKMVSQLLAVAVAMLLVLQPFAFADDNDEVPTVTLNVTDAAIADVAAQIAAQAKTQVYVTEETTVTTSLQLEAALVEAAVAAFAESFNGSWVRGYILETSASPPEYQTAQLITMMEQVRDQWTQYLQSLSEEERRELMGAAFGGRGQRGGQRTGPPGQNPPGADAQDQQQGAQQEQPPAGQGQGPGGPANAQGQQGGRGGGPNAQGQQGGPGNRMAFDDPLRGLMRRGDDRPISLQLDDMPLAEALGRFFGATGRILITPGITEGSITVLAEEAPINEVLDQFAANLEATWRPFYIVSERRPLSEEEVEQRTEQRFQRGMAELWAMTPTDRAERINRMVERTSRMSQWMQDAPPERVARMKSRMNRRFGRMTQYSAKLTPQQRKELKPLLRAMGQMAQQ